MHCTFSCVERVYNSNSQINIDFILGYVKWMEQIFYIRSFLFFWVTTSDPKGHD